jgi:hypothetical protein
MVLTPVFHRLLPALDPFVLVIVPLLLLACGVAACLIPARRAAGVNRTWRCAISETCSPAAVASGVDRTLR